MTSPLLTPPRGLQEFLGYFKEASRASSAQEEARQVARRGPRVSASRLARGAAERAKHTAELHSAAYKALLGKIRRGLEAKASDVLRACAIVDPSRSGYCHKLEFKVVMETYLLECQQEHFQRFVKPFEAAGDPNRIDYKKLVAQHRRPPADPATLHATPRFGGQGSHLA